MPHESLTLPNGGQAMIVRITAKLAKQIGAPPLATLPLAENPYADWTCRVFGAQDGHTLMLITNTAFLYSLLAPADGLNGLEQFGLGLNRHLERCLLDDGFTDIFMKRIAPELQTITLAKSLNRSITGSMTDMVKLTTLMLDEGKSLHETAGYLNRTPFQLLEYIHPREQFAEMMA